MDLPKLENIEQVCIIRSEYSTGIILNNDNSYWSKNDALKEYYLLFDNINEAKKHIDFEMGNSKIKVEFCIYNYKGDFIEVIRP